jgi:TnpA family transposase
MPTKAPRLLSPEQRDQLSRIPTDLPERDLARHYTFTDADLALIGQRRRDANRLGFALQLAVLRYPGRTLADVPEIPPRLLAYVAEQVDVSAEAFAAYGARENTVFEHLAELRRVYGYRMCGWSELRALAGALLPLALESDHPLPLVETALERLRAERIVAPGITTIERVVWSVRRRADQRVERWLTQPLTARHRDRLEALLQVDPELRGRTRLSWLREAPELASARGLRKVVDRLTFLRNLDLPAPDRQLHPHRLRQLARRSAQYPVQPLAHFPPERRQTLLAAELPDLRADLTDQALDMLDKLLGELLRKGERKQEARFQTNAKVLNRHLSVFIAASDALLTARRDGLDPFAAVFEVVPEETLAATVASSKQLVRPLDFNARDLISREYAHARGALLALLETLDLRAASETHPALEALAHVQRAGAHQRRVTRRRQTLAGEIVEAPLGHVTERWRQLVFEGKRHLNATFYELAALEALKDGLRSGDLYVLGSHRYASFESYLLPKDRWTQLKTDGQTRLPLTSTAEAYLERQGQRVSELLRTLHRDLGELEGLTTDEEGELHLSPLDKGVPEAAEQLRRQVERRLPPIALAELLNDVDLWTGCFRHLTHLSSGEPLTGERKQMLLAAIMGLGLNHGLGKMAYSTPYSYRQLAWTADWHVREETLTRAQAELDNFVLHHPFARHWGDGSRSSSDGMRVRVAVKAANAERNARFFGTERGASFYTHTADIRLPFAQKVISTNDREALHVIDALCSHETDLQIQEHFVDTGGYTTHVFALCAALGFRFAPRIRDVLDQRLFTIGPPEADYGPFTVLLRGRINTRLVRDTWDDVLRVAASIRHGTVSAALLMRKLAAYPRQNRIARALNEIGQLEKTIFILEYLGDPALRKRVQRGLNRSEAVNSIARALFSGQRGELRDRLFQDQVHRASCLHLLISAIGAWTTPYLAAAVERLRAEGTDVPDEYLTHLSPLAWEHINLLGQYTFDASTARPLARPRALRNGFEEDGKETNNSFTS